jgi:hypothetical protein
MKSLLITIALLEGLTGLALATVPSFVVSALLGTSLTDASGLLLGRLAGAVLMCIAMACWLLRQDPSGTVIVKIMTGYHLFAIMLLVYAGVFQELHGFGLWPTVLLHLGLLAWCVTSLIKQSKIQTAY